MEFYDEVKWHYPGDTLFSRSPKEGFYTFEINEDVLLLKEGGIGEVQKYSRVE